MNIKSLALVVRKKYENSNVDKRFFVHATLSYLLILLITFVQYRIVFSAELSKRIGEPTIVASGHLVAFLLLWWQVWICSRLMAINGSVAKQTGISVFITMVSWEILVLAILRIFGAGLLFALPGTLALLGLGVGINTVILAQRLLIKRSKSLVISTCSVLALYPHFVLTGWIMWMLRAL